jgi:hypothetical protein
VNARPSYIDLVPEVCVVIGQEEVSDLSVLRLCRGEERAAFWSGSCCTRSEKGPSIYAKVTGLGTAANFEYQRHKAVIVHFPSLWRFEVRGSNDGFPAIRNITAASVPPLGPAFGSKQSLDLKCEGI